MHLSTRKSKPLASLKKENDRKFLHAKVIRKKHVGMSLNVIVGDLLCALLLCLAISII